MFYLTIKRNIASLGAIVILTLGLSGCQSMTFDDEEIYLPASISENGNTDPGDAFRDEGGLHKFDIQQDSILAAEHNLAPVEGYGPDGGDQSDEIIIVEDIVVIECLSCDSATRNTDIVVEPLFGHYLEKDSGQFIFDALIISGDSSIKEGS